MSQKQSKNAWSASSNFNRENQLFKRRKLFHEEKRVKSTLLDIDWRKIRELIRKSRIDLAKQPLSDDYIINLIKKNKIYGDNMDDELLQQKFSKWISSVYYSLNEFLEARSVMQIISTSPDLMIVFDLSRHHVACIDPSSTEMTDGVTYGCYDQIIIAAKDLMKDENKLQAMGLVIHEFCHYAVHLTYCNIYQPYLVDDKIRMSHFELVINECRVNHYQSEVIEKALYYQESEIAQELIVRYVQALIEFSDKEERMSDFRRNFPLLSEYYEDYLIKDFLNEYCKIKAINQINSESGLEEKMKKLKMLKQNCQNNKLFQFVEVIKLKTNSSLLTMNEIYHRFCETENFKSIFIFTSLKYVTEKDNFQLACEAMTRIIKPILILNCEFSSPEIISSYIAKFSEKRLTSSIVLLCQQNDDTGDGEMIHYTCNNLSIEFLDLLTSKTINFQDKILFLSDLVLKEELCKFLNIPFDVLNEVRMNIGISKYIKRLSNYVERKFTIERNQQKKFNADEILELDLKGKILLLANKSGFGKSIETNEMFFRFKNKYPEYWVVLIDLKNHYKTLENISNSNLPLNSIKEISWFLCHYFLYIKGFEEELFEHLLSKNRIIFMFDSFDEISPKNIYFVLNMISKINELSNCTIWLSTRLHLLEKIKQVIRFQELRLEEFNEPSRKIFLAKYLSGKNVDDDGLELKIMKIEKFLAMREFKKFQNPLMIFIISEIIDSFDDEEESTITIYRIYEMFTSDLILNSFSKGQFIKRECKKIGNENLDEFFQYFSLKKFVEVNLNYDEEFQIEFNDFIEKYFEGYLEKPNIEILKLFDIITFENSENFNFIHQNFIDFYVVKFMKCKLLRNPREIDFKILFDIFGRSILTRNFKLFLEFVKSSNINSSSFKDFKLIQRIFLPQREIQSQQRVNIGKLLIFFCRSFEKIVWRDKVLSEKFKHQSIYSLLFYGLNETFDTLENILDNQQMHQLINYRDCLGRTIFHNFFTFDDIESLDIYNTTDYEIFVSMESFEIFVGKIINFLGKNDIKTLLRTKNRYGRYPFLDAAISNFSFPVEVYLKLHENFLMYEKEENLNYFIFTLILNPQFENLNVVEEFLMQILKIENQDFPQLLMDLNGQNVFQLIARSLEYFPTIDKNFLISRIKFLSDLIKDKILLKEMLLESSTSFGNALKISSLSRHSKGFQIFYESIKSLLSKSEIENLFFLNKDNDEFILYCVFWQSNETFLEFALSIYEMILKDKFDSFMMKFLLKENIVNILKNDELSWEMSLKIPNNLDKNSFVKTKIELIYSRLKDDKVKKIVSEMIC